MLQLTTSGWYLHRLTVAAIKGAQYHLYLPPTPRLLLGLLGRRSQAAGEPVQQWGPVEELPSVLGHT